MNEFNKIFTVATEDITVSSNNNVITTYDDVYKHSTNPTVHYNQLYSTARSISEELKYIINYDMQKKFDNVYRILEENLEWFIIGDNYSKGRDTDRCQPQEYIRYRVGRISNIKSLKEKLISDQRTFSCFDSCRVDSLIVIFKLDRTIICSGDYIDVLAYYQDRFEEEFVTPFTVIPYDCPIVIPYDPGFYVNYDCVSLPIGVI
jgi:hypothetical protein